MTYIQLEWFWGIKEATHIDSLYRSLNGRVMMIVNSPGCHQRNSARPNEENGYPSRFTRHTKLQRVTYSKISKTSTIVRIQGLNLLIDIQVWNSLALEQSGLIPVKWDSSESGYGRTDSHTLHKWSHFTHDSTENPAWKYKKDITLRVMRTFDTKYLINFALMECLAIRWRKWDRWRVLPE